MLKYKIHLDPMEKVAYPDKLRSYRIKRGFTQARLAQKVGVLNTTISNYEKGVSLPDYETFMKISRTLNVDPGEFYVDWRLKDPCDEDYTPIILQAEQNLITRQLSRWFLPLPLGYEKFGCRAWVVPQKYCKNDKNTAHIVIMTLGGVPRNGEIIVLIADGQQYIGEFQNLDETKMLLLPFTKWDPDFDEILNFYDFENYEVLGKVIGYNTQEIHE